MEIIKQIKPNTNAQITSQSQAKLIDGECPLKYYCMEYHKSEIIIILFQFSPH